MTLFPGHTSFLESINLLLQRQWLDILEDTKKKKAARDKQKKEAALRQLEQQKETTAAAKDKDTAKDSPDSSNRE